VLIIFFNSKACSIGFLPVAVHFELFNVLVKLGRAVSSKDVADEANKNKGDRDELGKFDTAIAIVEM
jgi:hypothetical protein